MRRGSRILFYLSFCLMLLIMNYYYTNIDMHASKKVVSNVDSVLNIEYIEDKLAINKIQELKKYYDNDDVKGIISIDGIEGFNYPVAQYHNNDYYLNHNYYKKYDSYGSIYADYRVDLDNSSKVLIYGHSSVKREVPFNILENYEDKDYYDKHKYITLETETETYKYEIFSVYVETNDFTFMNVNFDNKGEWYAHILKLQDKSIHSTDVVLNSEDDILILQTCSTNSKYRNYSKKYLLIVSRRVK